MGALEKGVELFAEQQYPNGEFVDNTPAVLVVPASWVIRISDSLVDLALHLGKLTIIRTGRVQSGYLFANPAAHPAIVLAGLNNDLQPELTVNTKPKMNLDIGLELRVLHDFAAIPVSRLGIVKMSVTA